jgi:hypothetical protein
MSSTARPPAVVGRMAHFIVQVTSAFGNCTEDDLKRAFTQADVRRHVEAARSIAARRMQARQLEAA